MDRARIEAYVEAGRARGVTQIAITEHLFRFREAFDLLYGWWDEDPDPHLASMARQYWQDHVSGSVADYVRVIEQAKRDGLPVLLGLEMDWVHGRAQDLAKFLSPYDWDIVLGSVHWIGSFGFDQRQTLDEWAKRDVGTVWQDYGELVRELAESGLTDVLAHPDLPKVFGHRPKDETPLHDLVLAGATEHGTAVELNSNGIRRCNEIYPAKPLLERAHAAGLAITLASDAHVPERVGADFDALRAGAAAAGYDEAVTFVQRQAEQYSIVT